ncbi:MAG: hypothetical protein ABEJ77_04360 [Halanaeroarchaeum sp.]
MTDLRQSLDDGLDSLGEDVADRLPGSIAEAVLELVPADGSNGGED